MFRIKKVKIWCFILAEGHYDVILCFPTSQSEAVWFTAADWTSLLI